MHSYKILFILAVTLFVIGPGSVTSDDNPRRLALTIDDLPTLGHGFLSGEEQRSYFIRILDILDKNKIKTIGFATGNNLNEITRPLLDSLIARGHLLGNHTYAHSDLNQVSASDFIADIVRLEKELPPNPDGKKYFRYPMLHRGDNPARKDSVALFLKNSGYIVMPVTIDNDDWRFNRNYIRSLEEDLTGRAEEIAGEYIIHMTERVEHFETLGLKIARRPIPHILLLHMNYLNSHYLDELLGYFKSNGWEFIKPEEALADSVFSLPDNYMGRYGVSWLERIDNR